MPWKFHQYSIIVYRFPFQLEEMRAMKSREADASTGHAVNLVTSKKPTTRVACARSLETQWFAVGAILPASGEQVWENISTEKALINHGQKVIFVDRKEVNNMKQTCLLTLVCHKAGKYHGP